MARPTIRCPFCRRNQFVPRLGKCVACKKLLAPGCLPAEPPKIPPRSEKPLLAQAVGQALLNFRNEAKLSQVQLAVRIEVPRTYVSKIENAKMVPNLASIYRMSAALGISASKFVDHVEALQKAAA